MTSTHILPPINNLLPPNVPEIRCAGWAPEIDLPNMNGPLAPPHMVRLERPKEMAGTWSATKTHLMSSFCFNLTSVTCRELYRGVDIFQMSDWLGLDANGNLKDQSALVSRLLNAETLHVVERAQDNINPFNNYSQKIKSTKYDTILFGSLNDGTRLSIHIKDFCPWIVFQFDNKKLAAPDIAQKMQAVQQSDLLLESITFKIEARACSDGILPSKRNPYHERKYNYVYIYTPDSSYMARRALLNAMEQHGARPVEDDALSESIRFLQTTKMCPTEWYTVLRWESVQYGYVTRDQIEICCSMQDIIPMINPPEGIVLPPHTEVYWDIEHHQHDPECVDSAGKREFATPDDILNNILCINVAMYRTGAFDVIDAADKCRRNMPRMDDIDIDLSSFMRANPDESYLTLPDPLEVEEAMYGKGRLSNVPKDQPVDDLDQDAGEFENEFEAAMAGDFFFKEPDEQLVEDLIRDVGKGINIANLTEDGLDSLDDVQNLTGLLKDGVRHLSPPIDSRDSQNGSAMEVDVTESMDTKTPVMPETASSMATRHGYEIPQWAIKKLGARIDLAAANQTLPDLAKVQTPLILNNCKHVRRISFFVDPHLNVPCKKFLLKPLYIDDGDGILVYAYKHEANALVAFRDFLITSNPDVSCGHFTRSYDWKTLFVRANCVLQDTIPAKNLTRDNPILQDKLMHNLPILEYKDMLSTPTHPFPVNQKDAYYAAITDNTGSGFVLQDAKSRQQAGREVAKKIARTSCFAFMNRLIFSPVQLTRKITRSNNTAPVESLCPSFDGLADIDSLVCIRLALATLKSFKLNDLSRQFLNDAKMDITIPRMNAAYRQKQYWGPIVYCDYDCVLVAALMSVLSLRMAHAGLARCCHLSMHDIPNFGQQRRIFVKNAVVAHNTDMVLVRCGITCPQVFGGGSVGNPNGGIYPVPCGCLDYVSFYVTLMMTHNFCFTAYMIPWDENFDPIDFNAFDPIEALKTYRRFARNLRRVYGVPDYKKRPNSLPYYTCLKCGCEDFSLVPQDLQWDECKTLPSHEMLNNDEMLASKYTKNVPKRCPGCQSKPWLREVEAEYDTSLIPDCSSPLDPYRELRYATDFDYLVPRSSMVSFQSDPEAFEMHSVRRYLPGSSSQYVREDVIVEHESFDWIDDDRWAHQRYEKSYAAFLKTVAEKKSKKNDLSNAKYVPSLASFVLWRPGDFDNQAKRLYVQNHNLTADQVPVDEAEQAMLATIGKNVWSVESFAAYADSTAHLAASEKKLAFESRKPFDATRFDIRSRRGIVKFGSTTGNVEKLFLSRKATRSVQGKIMKNSLYYDAAKKKWLSGLMKTVYNGLEAEQLAKKGSANSAFGAAGAKTGSIKNTFVAAAITFMSRNMIYYTTYVTVTRWCPPQSLYERICHFRALMIEKRHQVTGLMAKYLDRYVFKAPWPTHPDAGRQVWLKPICSAYQYKNDPIESLWGTMTVYGDTDSIFECLGALVLGDPDHPNFELDVERKKLAIDICEDMAGFITRHFRMCSLKWMTIEFEKMMYPFVLFDKVKKRYIGGHYEQAEKMKQITTRSWGIKRDIVKRQQEVIKSIREALIKYMNAESVDQLLESNFAKMIESAGEIENLERDVIPYSKSQAFNKVDYVSAPCHAEANHRLAAAYPGQEHALGDRIDYVICYDPSQPEVTKRSWTVSHIKLLLEERDRALKNGMTPPRQATELRIDIPYYVDQYLSTLHDVHTITKPRRQIYERPCQFSTPASPLSQLVSRGAWPNMLLCNASPEEHLAALYAVEKKDAPSHNPPLSLKDLQSCRAVTTTCGSNTNSNIFLVMKHGSFDSDLTSAKKGKKHSGLAQSVIDRHVAAARRKLSSSLSKTFIGIHSFFGGSAATDNASMLGKMFGDFYDEQSKKTAAKKELEREQSLNAKKRAADTPDVLNRFVRKAPKKSASSAPRSQNALITSFFAGSKK